MQGESVDQALADLQEATELYLEEFPVTMKQKYFLTTKETVRRFEKFEFTAVHQKCYHIVMCRISQGCVVTNHINEFIRAK